MTRKTIFEWAELFQEDVSNGASQSDIVQMLEDYKKEQLTIPVVVKSLPCGDEIWLKAQETDRFLFEEWFDELKQAMFYNDSICAARHEVEYIPCYILARN